MLSDEELSRKGELDFHLLLCSCLAQQEGTFNAVLMAIKTSLVLVLMRLHPFGTGSTSGTLPNPPGPGCSRANSSQGEGSVLLRRNERRGIILPSSLAK